MVGLEGKVALITGGANNIGACIVKIFAQHGAEIIIADVEDDLGQSVSESLGPSNCTYIHCDVTNEDHIKNAIDKTVSTYGKLDIMFNNARINDPPKPRIIDNKKADFERFLTINMTGVFLGMKNAARVMVPARSGCILSTTSLGSNLCRASSHAYCCSKHALVGLDDYDFEKVTTTLGNLKGVTLWADNVVNGALYLASDEAKYVNGHNLFIDGGFGIVNSAFKIFQYPDA
ncbi:hypothetical protein RJ639_006674 [Escallonia herrerae]|uniref:Alcohol dehydrogenase n=1 Tax=Escallonia herrerae TaxID=1293975 RepID=A0AA88VXT2_9ASTE|nr:hypothetical protein RJ639_006674 [Escallonia herrerae]